MPPPPAHQITIGIYNRLAMDAALKSLLPDGVWLEVALPTSTGAVRTRFAIVSLVPMVSRTVAAFGRRAVEERFYMIKAVVRDLSPVTANNAAHRITELLEDVPVPATGYDWMTTYCVNPIETQQLDDADPKLAWQHRGGYYRAQYATL